MTEIKAVRRDLPCTRELRAAKRRTRSEWFIKGPLPVSWFVRAAQLPGRAIHVGLLVWFRVGCERTRTVRLAPGHRDLFGLNRHAVYRGLRALEQAGLITVSRSPGRAPVVTLEDPDG